MTVTPGLPTHHRPVDHGGSHWSSSRAVISTVASLMALLIGALYMDTSLLRSGSIPKRGRFGVVSWPRRVSLRR